jgi:pyruvate,water dikinase
MGKTWAYWLEELGQEQTGLVGRKCANLGEMTSLGLPVPRGFALSLDAYRDFMSLTGAVADIRQCIAAQASDFPQTDKFNSLSRRIRRIAESKTMSRDMEETILGYYAGLCRRCNCPQVAVAVRSAGPVSHPGQYETLLNISGEAALIDGIKKVWASSFNARSLAFRSQRGEALDSDPIGVAILAMVNARAAGVALTADPNTGDASRIVIEANWGLGESVVNGESTPDVYVLDKTSLAIVEKRLGPKAKCVVLGQSGVTETETGQEKATRFCLTGEETAAIARLGKKLEDHFGVPQDIEWAVDQDAKNPADSVVLLQCRPAVIAQQKSEVDQVIDLMLDRFSGGTIKGPGL